MSRLCEEIDGKVKAFLERPIEGDWPYLWIDATYLKVRRGGRILAPALSYDATDVYLTLMRNDVGFAEAGSTGNQQAAAAAVESLGAGNAVYDAVLWLTQDQAQQAFDALSGEAYGSLKSVWLEGAGALANITNGRLEQAFEELGEGDTVLSSHAEGPALAAGPAKDTGLWAQFYGGLGMMAANGGTSGSESATGGFTGGLDGLLATGGWA